MITPFVLRQSLVTPFFNSTRHHHVRTNVFSRVLNQTLARSRPQPQLLVSLRHASQAPSLQLEAPSILKFIRNSVWRRAPQYGRARDPFRGPPPPQSFWDRLRQQINSIDPKLIIWGILGLNGAVFAAWYVAVANARMGENKLFVWMYENFLTSWRNINAGRYWTVLTATISHQEIMHMAFNCLTFYWMAPPVLSVLGNARFLGLYFGGGVIASLTSLFWNTNRSPNMHSHGASGAIYSVITFSACLQPTASFLLFGVVPFPAWAFIAGILAWDGYHSLKSQQGAGKTDSAGHVGGVLAGMAYFARLRFFRF